MRLDIIVPIIAVFIGFVLWTVLPKAKRCAAVKKRAKAAMAGRESMTPRQFADAFFQPAQVEAAITMIGMLGKILIVDTTRIRPEDRLVGDLGLTHVDGLDVNWLIHDLADRYGVASGAFTNHDPTVRELVDLCCSATTR
jgi:hypothetical protein